jgi:hypothetical protein
MTGPARQLPGGSLFGLRDFCRTAFCIVGNEAAVTFERRIAPAAATHGTPGARHFAASCQCPRFPETITVRTPNL